MILIAGVLVFLPFFAWLHFKDKAVKNPTENAPVIEAYVHIMPDPTSTPATKPQTSTPSKPATPQTTPQTTPSVPQQAPAPTIIIVPTQSAPMNQPAPSPAPAPSTPPSPSPSEPATTTPQEPEIPAPTEEEAKPTINLDGNRVAILITFNWSATGFKEGLVCTANGKVVEQEGSLTVESVQPFTLTIVCEGKLTGSRTQVSLTK